MNKRVPAGLAVAIIGVVIATAIGAYAYSALTYNPRAARLRSILAPCISTEYAGSKRWPSQIEDVQQCVGGKLNDYADLRLTLDRTTDEGATYSAETGGKRYTIRVRKPHR
jgi:hypothetical protein